MTYAFHRLSQNVSLSEKSTSSDGDAASIVATGRCKVDWLSLGLALSGSATALALAALGLYSAHVQPIKLYGDDSKYLGVYEVGFGLLASISGGLIAAGAAAAFGAFLTRHTALTGASVKTWIHAPDTLRGRPSFSAGPWLFIIGITVAVTYSLSHAAATVLLAPVRTVFNQTLPGVYAVGSQFDLPADALDSVSSWDLTGAAVASVGSIQQRADETLHWFPVYLALGLNPALSRPQDIAGPIAFSSANAGNVTLNMSQYLVTWAPHIEANCSAATTCARMADSCTVDAGWSKQVLFRLPDTSLTMGKHEGDEGIQTRRLNLTSLASNPTFQEICSKGFASTTQQMSKLLTASALSAYNKTTAAPYHRVGLLGARALRDERSLIELRDEPNSVNRSRTGGHSKLSVANPPAISGVSQPPDLGQVKNTNQRPQAPQQAPSDTVTIESQPSSSTSSPAAAETRQTAGAAKENDPVVSPHQPAQASSETAVNSYTTGNSAAAYYVSSGVSAPSQAASATSSGGPSPPPQSGAVSTADQTAGSATSVPVSVATDSPSAVHLAVSGEAPSSMSTSAANGVATSSTTGGQSPSSTASSSSALPTGNEAAALTASPGTIIDNINYWCIFTQPSQQWYCMFLCIISAATLSAGVACLRMPHGLDLSKSSSVTTAVARSSTACQHLSKRYKPHRYVDQRLSWIEMTDGQSKLFPA